MVKLKNDHENDLIEKFSRLLNEKKLKIRDQQRLLATANIDQAKASEMARSRLPAKSGSAGPSKPRKRKAGQVGQDETDSDDGFQKMDVDDQEEDATDSDVEPPRTPDRESTAEADSDNEDRPAPPPARTTISDKRSPAPNIAQDASDPDDPLPPRRDLPFSKKPAPVSKQSGGPTPAATGDTETESDDDEL